MVTLDARTVPGSMTSSGTLATQALALAHSELALGTAHTLPEGMRLLDYEIVAPIGEGGFGIVYLAWDRTLEQHVAIKEYLPAVLATRASISPAVVVKSQRHDDGFRAGLRSFVNEGRMLARFNHPSLVRVLHLWEANGTAYMAMPYYSGPTLARALADLGRPPDEAQLMAWLEPLLDALGTMHAANCFHRDIAPDNILLTDTGPVLLDFGAARRVIDGVGQPPTVVLKPGYAPIEQYGEAASMKQGAWTDLYALAGVLYMAITGRPPMPSIERLMDDRLRPLSEVARGRYSVHFLAAIDVALSLHPRNRPQSTDAFWRQLSGEASADAVPGIDSDEAGQTTKPAPRTAPAPIRAEGGSTHVRAEAPEPTASRTVQVVLSPLATRALLPAKVPARHAFAHTKGFALGCASLLVGLAVAGYFRVGDRVVIAPPPQPIVELQQASPTKLAIEPRTELEEAPAPEPAVGGTRAPGIAFGGAEEAHRMPEPSVDAQPKVPAESAPAATTPAASAAPPEPEPATAVETPVSEPVRRARARTPEPLRATRRESRATSSEVVAASPVAKHDAPPAASPARSPCTDILQRASLGPLGPDELAHLKKGCE